jgi:hypothetical protein
MLRGTVHESRCGTCRSRSLAEASRMRQAVHSRSCGRITVSLNRTHGSIFVGIQKSNDFLKFPHAPAPVRNERTRAAIGCASRASCDGWLFRLPRVKFEIDPELTFVES